MSISSFNRSAAQLLLLSAAVGFAHQADAAVVVVSRPVAPVVVTRVAVTGVHYGWADVLRVSPVYAVANAERHEECVDQPVVVHQDRRPGGALLGAVAGGVLGSTIGKGDGRTAATVVGAVAGGAIGGAASRGRDYETTATDCHTVVVAGEQREILGYDVEYRYRGEVYASHLSYDPGLRMRVRVDVSPVG